MSYSARIPTFFNMEIFSGLVGKANAEMNQQNLAIASTFSTNFWSEDPDNTRTTLAESCAALRADFEIQSGIETINAMNQRDISYKQMEEILTQFKGMCAAANNSANTAYTETLTGIAGLQKQFITCLNIQDPDGNYLFSGTASNILPVDMTQYTPTPNNLTVSNVTYYQGSPGGDWPTAAAPFAEQALRAFVGMPQAFPGGTTVNFDILAQIENLVDAAFSSLNFDASLPLGNQAEGQALEIEWFKNVFLQSSENYRVTATTDLVKAVPAEISLQQQASLTTTTLGGTLAQMSVYARQLLTV